ncbi:MAG: pseudouridine synthase [Pseudomonadota bacterium]
MLEKGERIAKVIARSGVCSRRDAEKLVLGGKVSLNGKILDNVAQNVGDDDVILVNGKPIAIKQEKRLWLYYKPVGLVTSHKDELGRKTVFESLPSYLPRVVSIGRLDINSEGLLLLTNDGELARYIELPKNGWKRSYQVRVYGLISPSALDKIRGDVTIEGEKYSNVQIELDKKPQAGKNLWLNVVLSEGKNREIRKLFEHIDCRVNRLIRVSYGQFHLANMKPGEIKEVPRKIMLEYFGKKVL